MQRTALRALERHPSLQVAAMFERLRQDLLMAVRPYAPCTLAGLQYDLNVPRDCDAILSVTGLSEIRDHRKLPVLWAGTLELTEWWCGSLRTLVASHRAQGGCAPRPARRRRWPRERRTRTCRRRRARRRCRTPGARPAPAARCQRRGPGRSVVDRSRRRRPGPCDVGPPAPGDHQHARTPGQGHAGRAVVRQPQRDRLVWQRVQHGPIRGIVPSAGGACCDVALRAADRECADAHPQLGLGRGGAV